MDRLDAMRAFVGVVQAGSFSAAAKRLGISQSAVSKKVAALEQYLEVDLLRRNSRALSLTEVGAEYYGHATRVLEQLDLAEASIAPGADRHRGPAFGAMPRSGSGFRLPPAWSMGR